LQPSLDIALVRVDNRLIHGQILEAWIPCLNITSIFVVDDEVASDLFRETVIRMAVPSGIKVHICTVDEFAREYPFHRGKAPKSIVLFSKINDAWTAYSLGFHFDHLNIGNVYNEVCKICCTPAVLLNESDIQHINRLRDAGVKIEVQRVPREKPIDLFEIVGKMQA
jgi:PTS system mannose-specific IIB component